MWGKRWTAAFLVLVTLGSGMGPMAMAECAPAKVTHCQRHGASAPAPQPAMPCHHAMAGGQGSAASESSVQAADSCCLSHCCCGAKISQWAHPAESLLSVLSLVAAPTGIFEDAVRPSSEVPRNDSARAPPFPNV